MINVAETCFHVAECETHEVLRTTNVSAFIPASQTGEATAEARVCSKTSPAASRPGRADGREGDAVGSQPHPPQERPFWNKLWPQMTLSLLSKATVLKQYTRPRYFFESLLLCIPLYNSHLYFFIKILDGKKLFRFFPLNYYKKVMSKHLIIKKKKKKTQSKQD